MGGKLSSYNVKHNDTIEVKKFVPGVINVHISGTQQTFQVNMKGTVRDAANEIAKECGIPNPGGYGLVLLERRSSTSPWLSRRGSQQPKWLDPGATLHSLAITASSQLQLQEFPRFSSFSVERTKAPPLKIIGQGSKSLDALSLGSPNVLNAPKVLPLVSDPNLEERISPDEPSITDIEVLQSREVPTPEGYISEEKPSIIPTSSGTEIQGEADGKEAAFDKGDDTKTVTTAAIRRVLSTEVLLSGQQIDVQTSASPHHMVETVRSPDMQKTPSLSPTTPESVEIKPAIKTRTSSYNSSPNRTIPQDSVLDCKDREERGLRSSSRDSSTMPLSKGTPEEPQIMEEGSNVEELATVLTLKTAPADDESKEDTSNSRVAVTLATHNTTPSNELEKKENTSSPVVLMEAHSTSGGGERGSENGQPNESHSKEKLPYSILKNFVSIGNQPVVSETSPVSDSPSASSQHKTMDMLMKEYAGRTETDAGLNHDPFVVVRRRKPQPKLPEPPEPSRKESKAIEELQAALAGFTFTTYTRRTSVTKKPEVKESSQSSTGRPSCRTETANPVPTENKPSVELQDNTSDVEAKEDMEGIQPKEDTGFGGLNEDISVVEPKGVMGGVEPKEATTDAEPTEKAAGIELKGNTGSDEVEKNAADTESKENRTNDELKEKVEDLPTSAELNSSVANCESKENSTTRELQEDSALPELQEEGLACGLHGSSRSSPQLPKLAGGHLTLNGGPRVDPPMTHPITLLVTEESESFSTEPIVGSPIPSEGRTLSSVGEEFSTITTQEPEDVSNDDTTERSSSLVEENGENTSSSSQQLGNAWTPAGPTGDQKSMSTQRAVGNTDTASQETTPWLQSGGVHKDSVSYSSQQGPSNNTCEWGKDSMKKTLPLPGLASATAVGNRAALLSNDQFVDEYSEQGKSDGLVLSFNNPLRYSNEPEDIAMLQDMWYEEMRSPSPEDNYGRNFRKHQGEIPNSDEEEDPEIMALFTDTSTSSDVGEIEIGVCESSEASPYKPDVEKMEAAVTKTLYTFPRNDGLPQKKVSSLPPSEENEHKVLAHSSEGFKETAKEGVSAMITPSPSHRNTQKDEQNSDNRPAAIKDVGVAGNIVNSSNMQDLGSSSSPQLTIRREPLKFSPDLVSSNQKNVSPAEIRPCRSTDERLEDPSEPPQGSEDHTTRYGTPVPWVGPSVCLTTSFHTWDPTSSRRRHRSTELLEQLENKPLKKGMKSLDNVFSCSTEDDRGIFDFMGQKSSRNVGKIVSSSQPFSSSNHNATATEVKQLPKEIADREEVEALKIPLLSEELSPTDKKKREFHPEQSLLSNKVNLPREPLQVDSPVGEGKSFEEVSEPLLKSVDSLPVESQTNVLSTEEECSEEKCSTEEEQLFSTPVTTITTSCEPPPPCEGQVLQTLSLDTPAARMVENSSNLEENVAVGEQKSSEEVPEPLLKAVDSLPVESQTNVLSTEEECSEEEQPFYSPIAMEVTSNKESQKGEEKSVCVDETESGGSSITLIKVSNEEHGPNEYAKKFESVTIETPPLCQSSADDYKGNHQSLPPLVPIVAVEHPQASIQNNSLPVESLTNALSTEECSEGKATTEEEQPFSTPVVMETSANAPSQGSEGQFVLTMPSDIPVAMVIDSSPNEDESVAGEDIVREGKSSEEVPEPLLIAVNSLPVESQTNVLSTEEECSEEKSLTEEEQPFSSVTTATTSHQLSQNDTEQNECLEDEKSRVSPVAMVQASAEPSDNNKLKSQAVITDIHSSLPPFIYEHAANMPISHVAMETAHDDVGGVERESSKISQENFWGFEENRKDKNLSCGTRDQLTQQRHFNQLHYDRKPGDISPSSLSAKEFWGLNENSSNIRPSSPDDSTYRHHDNSFAISKDLVSEKTDDHHQDVPCKEEDESFWGFEAKGSGTDIHNAASGPLNDEDILIQQDLQFGEGSRQRVTSPSPSSKEFWGLHGDGDSKMGNTPSNVYTHHQHGSGSTSPSGVLLDTSVTHQRQPTREEGKEFWGFADSPEEPKLSRTSKDQEFHQDGYSLHVNVTKQDISSPSPSSKEFWGLHDNGNSSHGDNDNRSHGGNENGSHGNSDSGNHGNSSTVETPLTQQEVVEEAVAVDHQTHLTMGTKRYSRLTSDMLVNEDFTFEELEAIVKECVSEPRDPTPTTIPSPSCNRTTTIPSPPHTQTTTIPSSPHTQTTTIPSPSHTRTTSIKSPPRDPLANELEKNTVPLHTSPQGQNREAMKSEHFINSDLANISSQEDNYAKQQHSVQVSDDGDVRQDASVSSISGRDVGVHANTISGPMIYVYFGDENGEGEGAAGEGSVTNSISSDVGTQHHTQKSSVSNEITSEMHSERENPSPTGEIPDEIYNSNILYPQGRRASTEEILNFLYPSSPVLERGEEFSFKGVKGESFEFEVGPQTGEFEVGRQEIEVEVGTQEVECEARTQVHEYKGFEVVKHEGELEVVKVGPGGDGEFEGFHEDEQEMKHTNPMSHTHSMGHTHIEYYPHTMDHTHGVDHPRPMDHTHRVDHTHSGVHAEGLSDPDRLRGEETAWTQENNEEEGPTPSHHSTPGPHVQEQAGVQLRRCFVPLRDEPEVVPSAYRQPKASSVRGRKERRRPPFERAQSEEDHLQSRRASSTSSEGPTVTTATNMESTVAERPQRQRRKHHSSGTGVEYKVDYQPVVGGGVYPDHMTSLPDVLDSQRKTASTDTIDDDVFANSRAYGGSRDFPYSRGVPLPYGIQFTGAQTPSWSKLDATSQDRIYNSTDTMLSGHYTSSREVLDSDDEGLTASGHTKDKKWSEGYFGAEHDAREYVKSPPNRHGNKDDDQVSITSQDLNQTRSLDYHNMPYEDIASNYVVLNVIIMDQDIRPFLVNPKRNVSDILRDICATFNIPSPGQWHFCIPKGLQVILQRVRSDSKTMLGGLDVTNGVSKKTQFLLASEIAPKEDTLDGEQPLEDQYTFTQKPYIIHMRKTDGRRRESIDGVYDECDIGLEWPDEEVDARRRCFFQSWCRIVKGDLPVERQVAAEIAALLLQAKFGDFDKKSKKTREFISTFLPEAFSGSKGVAKQVLRIYKRFNGITLERAMNAIIIRCREQPAHDGIFFSVKVVEEKGLLKISKLRNGLFGMCSREIVYLEPKSAKVIFRRSYSEISSVEASKRHFKISFGGHYSDPFAAASPVAFEIMNILKLFIQMQSLPPEFPQFEDSYTQVSQGTVPTMNEHQVELVNIV
jgi:hypothetical protein